MKCKLCNDSGIVIEGEHPRPCKCVLQKNILEYTEKYGQYEFKKKYATSLLAKDCMISSLSLNGFGSIAKSFLAYLYLKDSNLLWYDATGADIVRVNFGNDEMFIIDDFITCDFLILKLGRDSPNKAMGMWLLNLITKRKELGNITWVYIYPGADFLKLNQMYGDELMAFLKQKENFTNMQG